MLLLFNLTNINHLENITSVGFCILDFMKIDSMCSGRVILVVLLSINNIISTTQAQAVPALSADSFVESICVNTHWHSSKYRVSQKFGRKVNSNISYTTQAI